MLRAVAESRHSVMNFLSQAATDYPDAISFVAGRPAEAFFDIDRWLAAIPRFQRHIAGVGDAGATGRRLAQYGPTSGIINDLVSAQLAHDHDIVAPPERIVITGGCQEALALCLQALCSGAGDIALARNPTYIGVTGAAHFAGIPLFPIDVEADEDLPTALRRTILGFIAQHKRPRVLYVIPEFDNPTGAVLTAHERESLLAVCAEFRIVVLEDNPYGMFRFEGTPSPSLAALDRDGVVIYLGTFSKTLCPAVRVGFAVVPETLFGDAGASSALAMELSERKSFLTVNTSQLNQALVGGILLNEGCTLKRLVQPPLEFYRSNRDVLLTSLAAAFANAGDSVSWNQPSGGFFLSLQLPFCFGTGEMIECARQFHVLAMPMTFFALDGSQQERVRFSFSNVSHEEITGGVERFAGYVRHKLAREQ